MSKYMKTAVDVFLEYDTEKIVHIKSKKVGLINRVIQLGIIGYIIGWVLIYEKGYQSTDEVVSAITTKLKGVSYTDITNNPLRLVKDPTPYNRIWDPADYVVPPEQTDAFFVMSNMIITQDQQMSTCAEDPGMLNVSCTTNDDCPAGVPVVNGNGVRTGNCTTYTYPDGNTTKTCEIHAWCPVEYDQTPLNGSAVLRDIVNFTVLIKNTAQFTKFNFSKRNILETSDADYLKGCTYNKKTDKFCPIFKLGDIISETEEDFESLAYLVRDTGDQDFENFAFLGGVMGIFIKWDCNLDHSWDQCVPKYSFRRLDNKNAKIAKGYNFRYAHYFKDDSIETRKLLKAYGILFQIIVTGEAGKFDIIPLFLNIGAGLALLSLATIVCDMVVLYVLKKRHYYKNKKYLMVDDVDGGGGYEEFGGHSDRGASKQVPSTVQEHQQESHHQSDA
ncbi:P2X purinoceptor 4-like isoform X2 [Amphiura filiformis]|uniref:P2X purinoceptor 4-like isoform X2 n=1 Tax=Amphiura filiformis TaxID=82378 RepID=UPI003B2119F4